MTVKELKTKNMPEFKENKGFKMDSPLEYTPFKMKAKNYGNSPMKKNFGIGDSEMAIKTASPGKSKSPLQIFGMGGAFQRVKDMIAKRKAAKQNAGVDAAAQEAAATDPSAVAAEEPQAADAGGGAAVPPHGMESHTGGGAIGGKAKLAKQMGFPKFIAAGASQPRDRGMLGNLFSDIRLKEKIENTGNSPSGIPIYEFNYIGCSNRYSGAMAQDLLSINPDAVSLDASGYYKVNYNNIDVDMHLINN